jgi:hypothetical protein
LLAEMGDGEDGRGHQGTGYRVQELPHPPPPRATNMRGGDPTLARDEAAHQNGAPVV